MATDKNSRIGLRPFSEILGDLAGGDIERQLTNEIAQLARSVDDTGKAGKLVLTLDVGKEGKVLRVIASSKLTIPKEPIEATAFFVEGNGNLCKENPRQTKMPQVVDSVVGEKREN